MEPATRCENIVMIYTRLIDGIRGYDKGSLGLVICAQVKKSVSKFSEKYPDIFTVHINEEIKISVKPGAREKEVMEALNDLYTMIRYQLKGIMGDAGDGIMRNASKVVYKESISEIKTLRIVFPGWFRDQMQKAIWIDSIIKIFKG
ncbi:MAG: hypothetical protein V3R86_01485 [Candidatus Hydrothermarchaeaceae archaeon]